MRALFALSALLVALNAAPAAARDYPWCARTATNGFSGDCSFTSFGQCMATVSGQRGDCMQNPRLAFDRSARGQRNRNGWQDNGWNNNGWQQQGPGWNNNRW